MSDNTAPTTDNIEHISIEKEMQTSYLDYAMSVIVSRALPDVRDGLKPVHRRIIYAMNEASCYHNRPYRKSARIVGDVMGKYHPHGDSAIYDSLVRMAQDFSLRLPLVDGQGNFGSMDGDNAAAMRYTESRMAKSAHALVSDIDKDTVDWKENYDGSEKEPTVLPAEFPNMLVNGAGGIAVGMATNIPPHNLGESIDACCLLMDNPETTIDEIIEVMPAPDFPTGGIILGRAGATSAMNTGRGSVIMRGKCEIEELKNGKEAIIVTEVPYQVNKALMVEKIAALVREKKIEGITDLRDESDKAGVRVVIEVRRDVMASIILNQLYRMTPLQTSFGCNMLALNHGRPELMNVKQILTAFLDFREEVVTRRKNFLLNKARDRAHILIGLSMAVANIDEVIALIRNAPNPSVAKEELMKRDWNAVEVIPLINLVDDDHNEVINDRCKFTDIQARAILDMKLARLTGLEQERINEELNELAGEITRFLEILGNRELLMDIIKSELLEIKDKFATPRRSIIEESEFEHDIEDLIQREDMVVTVTVGGYIKRVPLATYRAQKRGGKGRSGMSMKDEDITSQVFVTNTHTPMLFFSTAGKAYLLKTYKLPLGTPQAKGRALINIFPLDAGETINVIMPLPEDEKSWEELNIVFATSNGNIRRNLLSDFQNVRANGKIAMKLNEGDSMVGVAVADPDQHIFLATSKGKAMRCTVDTLRVMKSRNSVGVRGIQLADGDKVISMAIIDGAHKDIETRDKFLRIPVDLRQEIASIATQDADTCSSPEGESDIASSSSLKEGASAVDTANISEESKQKIHDLLKEVETDLDIETIIEWAIGEEFIITVTENGFGKRSSAYEYRTTNRGTKGITNIVMSERNGQVVASFPVMNDDQIMLITDAGKLIRTPLLDVRIAGRSTQGVIIFRISDNEKVMSVAHITASDDEDDSDNEIGTENGDDSEGGSKEEVKSQFDSTQNDPKSDTE